MATSTAVACGYIYVQLRMVTSMCGSVWLHLFVEMNSYVWLIYVWVCNWVHLCRKCAAMYGYIAAHFHTDVVIHSRTEM